MMTILVDTFRLNTINKAMKLHTCTNLNQQSGIDASLLREEGVDNRNGTFTSYTLDYVTINKNPNHLSDGKADSSMYVDRETESHE